MKSTCPQCKQPNKICCFAVGPIYSEDENMVCLDCVMEPINALKKHLADLYKKAK